MSFHPFSIHPDAVSCPLAIVTWSISPLPLAEQLNTVLQPLCLALFFGNDNLVWASFL
jgi:hypothetical protein